MLRTEPTLRFMTALSIISRVVSGIQVLWRTCGLSCWKQDETEAERPQQIACACVRISAAIYVSSPPCHLALDLDPDNLQSIKS